MSFKPKFTITNPIANNLTQIVSVKGFLDAASLSKDWVDAMQQRALILEAYHTTHIEGTQLTLEQSEKLLGGEKTDNTDPDDVQELINYRDAFDLVAGYLGNGDPITEGLIREIHKRLVKGVRGNSAAPGEYRKVQNYVVNSKTGERVYTPPPAFEIQRMMQELVDYANKTNDVHPVLIAGIAQFQLVHIHPFLDGNGRTARLLSTLCLYRKGYDFKKLFTISEYYDRNRVDYYKAIQDVRENGMDMTGWLEYFVYALAEQMQDIKSKSEAVVRIDVITREHQLSDRQAKALNHILQHGELGIKKFEQICPNIPRRSLQRDLKGLINKKIIISEGATNQIVYKLAP
ncbi:MAG: Fic family protein [Gammaproteobacteria bacterium]|nr:Fic family protein [Gammaproteobacteria bacterium]